MAELDKLLALSKEYHLAHDHRNARFKAWTAEGVANRVKESLKKIVSYLQEQNDYFKSNLYADEYFPSIVENGETLMCTPMRVLYIKSGNTVVTGYNSESGNKFMNFSEYGFQIHFAPFFNGKIHVYVTEHYMDKDKEPDYKTLAVIDDPNTLDEAKIAELVFQGMTHAKLSSFLFQGEKS